LGKISWGWHFGKDRAGLFRRWLDHRGCHVPGYAHFVKRVLAAGVIGP
jgi:hypothetical protein